MDEISNSAPMWFTITNALFLVWNLFGLAVFALAMTKFRKREAFKMLASMNNKSN